MKARISPKEIIKMSFRTFLENNSEEAIKKILKDKESLELKLRVCGFSLKNLLDVLSGYKVETEVLQDILRIKNHGMILCEISSKELSDKFDTLAFQLFLQYGKTAEIFERTGLSEREEFTGTQVRFVG